MAHDDEPRRQQRAGFSVFLDQFHDEQGRLRWETRVYHAESGAEATFPGTSPEQWIGWMLDKVGADQPIVDTSASISVSSVDVVEVVVTEQSDPAGSAAPGADDDPLHTISAAVILKLAGLSRTERAIGAALLRGVFNAKVRRIGDDEDHR